MSKAKITPLGFGAVLYEFEEEAILFDDNGRVIRHKKSKPARPRAKRPTQKRSRKTDRRA